MSTNSTLNKEENHLIHGGQGQTNEEINVYYKDKKKN